MQDLVRGLQAGEARAYERLVREYGDRIHRFVRRMVGDQQADDVTQEAFARIHRSIASYVPGGTFDSWLFTIANNLCMDVLRRKRRERTLEEAREPSVVSRDPAEQRELQEAILRAVDRLPDDLKQVFLLREEAGVPFKEIARILGCPLNTALGRMHYAMEHLRASLKAFRD
ncbi:MAG: RNA polymerase sigma factor [Planctomycetes bacterium]|nr:RNA polymerase sigma factor [Planctomycetota bacterium]